MMEYLSEQVFEEMPLCVVEHRVENNILLLAPDLPAWVLVNESQHQLYKFLNEGESIDQSIKKISDGFGLSHEDAFNEMRVFVSMASNNGFLQARAEDRVFEKELVIYLTEDCNIRCKHCFLSAGKEKHSLPVDVIEKYLVEYASIKPSGKVLLTGGEPFLHPDLDRIIETGHNAGLKISVNTNGTLLTREWIGKNGAMLHGLQISIDGFSPDMHDSIRGAGSFVKSWRAVDDCVQTLPEGVVFRISVSVFPQNVQDIIDNILPSLCAVDPDRRMVVIFNPVAPLGRAKSTQSSNYAFINNHFRETFEALDANGWSTGSDIQSSIRQAKCGIGEYIVVRANGKMTPCNFSNDQNEFNSISDGLEFFKRQYQNCTVEFSSTCNKCDVRYICFGGCQVVNALEGKGTLEPNCDSGRVRAVLSIIVEDEVGHRNEILDEMSGTHKFKTQQA